MKARNNSGIHPSYKRLADAASQFGVDGEATITAKLKYKDQQKVNNWQRRGVSKDGALDAERYLGCPATWILDGSTLIESIPTVRNVILEMCELAKNLDDESVSAINFLLRKMQGINYAIRLDTSI